MFLMLVISGDTRYVFVYIYICNTIEFTLNYDVILLSLTGVNGKKCVL